MPGKTYSGAVLTNVGNKLHARRIMQRAASRRGRIVYLTECVDQKDFHNISRQARRRWTGAGVELLGNLLGKIQTSDWRDHRNSEFHESPHSGLDQIDLMDVRRPPVNFDHLP
jgi:hypothetical protein